MGRTHIEKNEQGFSSVIQNQKVIPCFDKFLATFMKNAQREQNATEENEQSMSTTSYCMAALQESHKNN
jgi:hypothetical protein